MKAYERKRLDKIAAVAYGAIEASVPHAVAKRIAARAADAAYKAMMRVIDTAPPVREAKRRVAVWNAVKCRKRIILIDGQQP